MNSLMTHLCMIGIVLNTMMFPYNLFADFHQMAVFNLLCAGGCWIGYFKHKKGDKNGKQY